MANVKGWKVQLTIWVAADDQNPDSVAAASTAARKLQSKDDLQNIAGENVPIEILSSKAAFTSRTVDDAA